MSRRTAGRTLSAALRATAFAVLFASATGAAAQMLNPPAGVPPEQAEQLVRSERFRHLAAELRCLVCQNQTLADSNADLAIDLRNEVLRQMAAGRDDREIKEHLVARFGEFVLYRPTFASHTLALWIGPPVLLVIGAIVIWRVSRRRAAPADAPPLPPDIDARLARIDAMLDEPDPKTPR
jgi:cytochrome c-type biogenesis protein CcmH